MEEIAKYIIIGMGAIGGIIASSIDTKDEKHNINKWGWGIIVLSVSIALFSAYEHHNSQVKANQDKLFLHKKLDKTVAALKEANQRAGESKIREIEALNEAKDLTGRVISLSMEQKNLMEDVADLLSPLFPMLISLEIKYDVSHKDINVIYRELINHFDPESTSHNQILSVGYNNNDKSRNMNFTTTNLKGLYNKVLKWDVLPSMSPSERQISKIYHELGFLDLNTVLLFTKNVTKKNLPYQEYNDVDIGEQSAIISSSAKTVDWSNKFQKFQKSSKVVGNQSEITLFYTQTTYVFKNNRMYGLKDLEGATIRLIMPDWSNNYSTAIKSIQVTLNFGHNFEYRYNKLIPNPQFRHIDSNNYGHQFYLPLEAPTSFD